MTYKLNITATHEFTLWEMKITDKSAYIVASVNFSEWQIASKTYLNKNKYINCYYDRKIPNIQEKVAQYFEKGKRLGLKGYITIEIAEERPINKNGRTFDEAFYKFSFTIQDVIIGDNNNIKKSSSQYSEQINDDIPF